MSAADPPSGSDQPLGAPGLAAEEPAAKGKSRNVKTPLQKEVLEASYQLNPNPNQQFRRTLAERIGLTEEQVTSWFSARRRKDKPKDTTPGSIPGSALTSPIGAVPTAAAAPGVPPAFSGPTAAAAAPVAAVPSTDASALAAGYASGYDSEAAGGASSMGAPASAAAGLPTAAGSGGARRAATANAGSSTDAITAELLEAAKKSLPVPFREDGPPLAFVFDTVPAPNSKKGMQAAALIAAKRKKAVGDPAVPAAAAAPAAVPAAAGAMPGAAVSAAAAAASSVGDMDEQGPAKRPRLGPEATAPNLAAAQIAHQEAMQQVAAMHATSTQAPSGRDIMKAQRERQREEARKAKEMEKARAAQERENKKREAQLERERKAEEKRKAVEEKRREKELAKALLQQERAAGRKGRAPGEGGPVHHHHGPPDDLDLEMEALLVRARATAAAQAAARGLDPSAVEPVVPPRPEFPPPYLMMQPAFPPELDGDLGPQLIEAWGFVTGFADLLGIPGFSMETLLSALLQGSSSPLLGLVHMILLRQAQADMEEAHATGVLQSPQPHLMDKALVTAAQRLEEAWAWGLDPDLWRAHLGPLTWPEILRQTAIAGGAGGTRVPVKQHSPEGAAEGQEGGVLGGRKAKKFRAPKGAVGFEGEDVLSGWVGDGPLKLQLPARFGEGTWMSAAWRVLSVAGPEGLPVPEVVRQIAIHGYRNLGTSKNPEGSVTGALSRDILFVRLKPGTYALQSIVTYYQRMQAAGKTPVVEAPQGTPAPASGATAMQVDGHDSDSDDEDGSDDEEIIVRAPEDPPDAEPWATTLKHKSYDALSLQDRVNALLWLIGIVVDGPGVRMRLEAREREVAALKKQLQEDMRAEKKRRQDEAAARARAAADQAQQRLEELQRAAAAGETVAPEAMAAAEAAAKALSAAAGGPQPPGTAAASRAATPVPPSVAAAAGTPQSAAGQQQQQDGLSPMQVDQQQQQQSPPAAGVDTAQGAQQQQQQQQNLGSQPPQQQPLQPGATPSQPQTPAAAVTPSSTTPQPQQQPLTEQQQQELKQKQEQEAAQRAEQEAEHAAESARRAARAEAIRRCEELNVSRLEPLGMDRRFNKYWWLVPPDFNAVSRYTGSATDYEGPSSLQAAGEPRDGNAGRIFVEYGCGTRWRVILRPQQLDQLKQVLEPRGAREGVLHQSLLRVEAQLRAAMPGMPFHMPKPLSQQQPEVQQQGLEASRQWLQRGHKLIAATLTDSKQEATLEAELAAADTEQQEQQGMNSPELVQLKRDMLRVEALLAEQLQATSSFDHQTWTGSVASATSLEALRDSLAQLEAALAHEGQPDEQHKAKKTRGQLKADAERIPLLSPAWKVLQDTPCVKGAWLVCGAEVAAAQLNLQGLLAPVLPALPAAETAEGGTPAPEAVAAAAKHDPAAAAAAAVAEPGKLDQRHEEMLQQHLRQRQGLKWIPVTVHALGLRLAALDAVLQYPVLGSERTKLYGREAICAFRYITKPAPVYPPATLDQLLSQEKAAATTKALPAPEQQQQRSASSPPEDIKQQQQQPNVKQEQPNVKHEQPDVKQEQGGAVKEEQQDKEAPNTAAEQQAVKAEQPEPTNQQQQDGDKQQEQQQQHSLVDVPTVAKVLNGRPRCAYGYSLAGRGLLQLIRGLPPYPDWTQHALVEEFSIPLAAFKSAVEAATADGTINMTKQQIQEAKEAEAARIQAEKAAKAAEKAAREAAARAAAEQAAAAAEAGEAPAAAPAAAAGKALPPKGKVKIKLGGQAGAAAAAKAGKGASAAAAAGGTDKGHKQPQHHEKDKAHHVMSNGAPAVAPKLRIKGKGLGHKGGDSSRDPSRENSPAPAPPAAAGKAHTGQHTAQQKGAQPGARGMSAVQKKGGAGGKGPGGGASGKLTGRLRLRHTGPAVQAKQEEEVVDEELMDSDDDD